MKSKILFVLFFVGLMDAQASYEFNCQFLNHFQTSQPASIRVVCGDKEGFALKLTAVQDFKVVAQDKLGGQRILTYKDLPQRELGYTLSEAYLRISQWLSDSKFSSFEMKLDPSTHLYADTKAQISHGPIGEVKVIKEEPLVEEKPKQGISWSHDEVNCKEHDHEASDVEKVLEKIKEM